MDFQSLHYSIYIVTLVKELETDVSKVSNILSNPAAWQILLEIFRNNLLLYYWNTWFHQT